MLNVYGYSLHLRGPCFVAKGRKLEMVFRLYPGLISRHYIYKNIDLLDYVTIVCTVDLVIGRSPPPSGPAWSNHVGLVTKGQKGGKDPYPLLIEEGRDWVRRAWKPMSARWPLAESRKATGTCSRSVRSWSLLWMSSRQRTRSHWSCVSPATYRTEIMGVLRVWVLWQ